MSLLVTQFVSQFISHIWPLPWLGISQASQKLISLVAQFSGVRGRSLPTSCKSSTGIKIAELLRPCARLQTCGSIAGPFHLLRFQRLHPTVSLSTIGPNGWLTQCDACRPLQLTGFASSRDISINLSSDHISKEVSGKVLASQSFARCIRISGGWAFINSSSVFGGW